MLEDKIKKNLFKNKKNPKPTWVNSLNPQHRLWEWNYLIDGELKKINTSSISNQLNVGGWNKNNSIKNKKKTWAKLSKIDKLVYRRDRDYPLQGK